MVMLITVFLVQYNNVSHFLHFCVAYFSAPVGNFSQQSWPIAEQNTKV